MANRNCGPKASADWTDRPISSDALNSEAHVILHSRFLYAIPAIQFLRIGIADPLDRRMGLRITLQLLRAGA